MRKVIGIVKNDPITGIEYGLVNADETVTDVQHAINAYKESTSKIHKQKTRHRQKVK